jgi:hypothetical protein
LIFFSLHHFLNSSGSAGVKLDVIYLFRVAIIFK